MAKRTPTVVSLFSGAGGLDLGLEQAGFKLVFAADHQPEAAATFARNSPKVPFFLGDVRELSGSKVTEAIGSGQVDLVAGGPPCQGFSTLGDKLSGDPRNDLFNAFARVVADLSPRFVLIENVKALTTMYGGRFRDHILTTFERLGYYMRWAVLDAADFGAPQFRKRVFFFGTKSGSAFSFPTITHGPEGDLPYTTTWQAIADLASKGAEVPNHIALDHSDKVIARYRLIPEGGRLPEPSRLPEEIRRKNFGNTYKRLQRDQPALTMVPGNNAFPVHPLLHRSLTPREAARLQTFPDKFVFMGDRRMQCILVGNAVPPILGKAVGTAILAHAQAPVTDLPTPTPRSEGDSTFLSRGRQGRSAGLFVDLFCGAGGITLGLSQAGWTPALTADINSFAIRTHRSNFRDGAHLDLDLAAPGAVQTLAGHLKDVEIGVLAGGPPCQGFSMFGKRRFVNTRGYEPHKDGRNQLVFAFVEAVRTIKPRWFMMENVPGLANLDDGMFLRMLIAEFKDAGYPQCEARILNAADYGVPQLRRRLLIIGNRTGHIVPWPKKKFFASPRDWQDPYRTVGQAISDLATVESHARHTCHVAMNHKPLLVERYSHIPEGGRLDVDSLPAHLRTGYRTEAVKNYSHVFKRLHRDKPSITMVPGHNAFPIHPWLNRALTVREAARLQTFPDEMEFAGPRQEQCIQVGNAFPPLLAEIIGANIRKAETNAWFPGEVPPSAYYALVDRPAVEGEPIIPGLIEVDPNLEEAA